MWGGASAAGQVLPIDAVRQRRAWDVADVVSRMLSRATLLQLPSAEGELSTPAIVPLHERLAQCDERGRM